MRERGGGWWWCIKAFNLGQNGRRFCSLTLWHCVRKFLRAMKMKIIRPMIDTKPKMMFGDSFDIHFLSVSSFWHWSPCVVLRVTEPSLASLKKLKNYLSEDLTDRNVARVNERRKKGKKTIEFIIILFLRLLQTFDKIAPRARGQTSWCLLLHRYQAVAWWNHRGIEGKQKHGPIIHSLGVRWSITHSSWEREWCGTD